MEKTYLVKNNYQIYIQKNFPKYTMINNYIINKFPYLEVRLFVAVIISIIIIITDGKLNMFIKPKHYIENSIYFFYHLCNKPKYALNDISNMFRNYKKIIIENHVLRQELLLKNSELLLIDQYKQENRELRRLLNSPLCTNKKKIVTKVLNINTDPCNHQIIINKGINDSVYIGQPVITDSGIVGQVISTNTLNSRVLLICDPMHALSVRIKRNNICMILIGHGYKSALYSEYPGKIDINIGDLLVTSGLDECFPAGYPVATVSTVEINEEQDTTIIKAYPTVKLQWLRNVILIW